MSDTTSLISGCCSCSNKDLPPDAAQASHQASQRLGLKYWAVCCDDRSCTSNQFCCGKRCSSRVPLGSDRQPLPSSLKVILALVNVPFTKVSEPSRTRINRSG